jgi:hypothetical protein
MKIALALLLAGSSLLAQSQAPNPRAACGPADVSFSVKLDKSFVPLTQSEPGKALVYLIQDAGPNARIAYPTTRLGMDGSWVGANKDSSYFTISVDPGEHHLCAMIQSSLVDNSVELAHFTAEAGKVYYYRTRLLLAYPPGLEYLELTPVDSDEAWDLVANYEHGTSTPRK